MNKKVVTVLGEIDPVGLGVVLPHHNDRLLFDDFDAEKISGYDERKISALLEDGRIIRNRLKINGTVTNAKAFLKVKEAFGGFDTYIWRFVGGKPIINRRRSIKDIPASTTGSDAMSKDLKKRGFTFVGNIIDTPGHGVFILSRNNACPTNFICIL